MRPPASAQPPSRAAEPPRALFAVGPHLQTVLGALPPALFGSGHSFFIQGLRQGALSVHATFQFGDDASFPYGKRMRLRQFGLWADPQAYFQGRFLALADAPLTPPPTLPDDDLAAQRLLLGLQFDADAVWRRRVTVGLAAARALNRTLVLPRAACYCERSWAALLRCRLPAVPRMPLPFVCPFDHMVNPTIWEKSGVHFRPPGFRAAPGSKRVAVRFGAPVTGEEAAVEAALAAGPSDAQLESALAYWREADVLVFTGDAPPLCGLSAQLVTPWHPARTGAQTNDLAAYLTDQRVFFCADPPGYVRHANVSGGMVAQLCGAAEEAYSQKREWDAFGRVRSRDDCPCEWGYAPAKPLPLLAGDKCEREGGLLLSPPPR